MAENNDFLWIALRFSAFSLRCSRSPPYGVVEFLILHHDFPSRFSSGFFCALKRHKNCSAGEIMPSIALATEGNHAKKTEQEKNMFYTYILRSISHPEQRYIGSTSDLKSRLAKHNAGEVPHTSKFKPWKIETAIAFSSKEKAYAFEAYLKTHSGRSFSNRHF